MTPSQIKAFNEMVILLRSTLKITEQEAIDLTVKQMELFKASLDEGILK